MIFVRREEKINGAKNVLAKDTKFETGAKTRRCDEIKLASSATTS